MTESDDGLAEVEARLWGDRHGWIAQSPALDALREIEHMQRDGEITREQADKMRARALGLPDDLRQ